ncbi:protein of unknown function [Tenacibaculum sp. 190524A02b]|uniref:hypothetical protein n=1 Tax=Tenacibaculum vairaonense TaxID=3137860 RepID=UPI0032B27D94
MEKSLITKEMIAFQLGFRSSLLLGANKETLETLIQEILEFTCEPKIMEAFHLGKTKGTQEKRVIEYNLNCEAKEREAFIKELEQKSLSSINFKK